MASQETKMKELAISEFAELFELTCDYVIQEFIIDDTFIPVFPEIQS